MVENVASEKSIDVEGLNEEQATNNNNNISIPAESENRPMQVASASQKCDNTTNKDIPTLRSDVQSDSTAKSQSMTRKEEMTQRKEKEDGETTPEKIDSKNKMVTEQNVSNQSVSPSITHNNQRRKEEETEEEEEHQIPSTTSESTRYGKEEQFQSSSKVAQNNDTQSTHEASEMIYSNTVPPSVSTSLGAVHTSVNSKKRTPRKQAKATNSSKIKRPAPNTKPRTEISLETIHEVTVEDLHAESIPEVSINSLTLNEEENRTVGEDNRVDKYASKMADKASKKKVLSKYSSKMSDVQVRKGAAELLARIESVSADIVEEAMMHNEETNSSQQRKKRGEEQFNFAPVPTEIRFTDSFFFKCVFPMVLIFLLVIIAGALTVILLDRFRNTEDDWSNEIVPVKAIQRLDNVHAYLVTHEISKSMLFAQPADTPESKAAQWLAWADEARIEIPSVNTTTTEAYPFLARYIMAVLYYAMNGPRWRLQFDFLSSKDVCEWRGTVLTDSAETVHLGVRCDPDGAIVEINLNGNGLKGEIPSELTRLSTLRILQMSSNFNIRGQLPSHLDQLTRLEHFALSRNQLTGSIPTELCGLSTLRYIFLGFNDIEGVIPECMDNLSNLETLFLSNNMLSGILPESLSKLRNLQLLWLDDNMLMGDITTTFNRLPLLRAIFLEDNNFEGTVDERFLRQSKDLIQLDVSGNRLTGPLPRHFFVQDEFRHLEVMDWHGNQLSSSLPDLLVPNNVLQFISLYDNSFTGALPISWGTHLSGVFHLDLSRNKLEGEIPSSIGNMVALTYLFMANNDWTPGPIPSAWSNLTRLQEFSVKESHRTGNIPEFLADFSKLKFLDMDGNELDGTIPTSLGSLLDLEFLLLNRNRLIGVIPPEFSQLTNLRMAFLEGNYLMGNADPLCDLPNFSVSDVEDDSIWSLLVTDCQGNDSTMWPVECDCCALCCDAAPLHHQSQEGLGELSGGSSNNSSRNTTNEVPANRTTSGNETKQEEGEVITVPSHPTRPACHDWTGAANLDPRWEMVYKRDSYAFGKQVWFDSSDSKDTRKRRNKR